MRVLHSLRRELAVVGKAQLDFVVPCLRELNLSDDPVGNSEVGPSHVERPVCREAHLAELEPFGAITNHERRLSRRVKVITENYGFKAGGLISVGVRFLGERLSADLGMFSPLSTEGFFAAPVVNFVWTVGK